MLELLRDGLNNIMRVLIGFFEDSEKVGRKCILTEEHKTTIINFKN